MTPRAKDRTNPFLTITRGGLSELVPVDKLVDHPANIRRNLGDVAGLAASIAAVGLLEELLVRARGDGFYEVVAGHRRLAAARQAGLDEVRCAVRELTDREALEVMLIENLQREDVDPVLEARVYAGFVADGDSQRQIAARIGRTQSQISKRLGLLDLPVELQEQVGQPTDSGGITLGQAERLSRLGRWPERVAAAWAAHQRSPWRGLDDCVERQLQEAVDAEAKAKAIAELTAAGRRYAEIDRQDRHAAPAATLGKGHGQLPMQLRVHRRLDCHASMVDHRGQVREGCLNPCSHPEYSTAGAAPKLTEAEKQQRAKTRERNKALRGAQDTRAEFLRALVAAAPPATPEAALVAGQWLRSLSTTAYDRHHAEIAAELAGVPVPAKAQSFGRPAAVQALVAELAGDANAAGRVVLSVGLAAGEWRARGDCWDDTAVAHIEFLKARGYTPAPVEASSVRRQR